MAPLSSNIYVSATKTPTQDEGSHRHEYNWLISMEPHKHVIPFMPKHKVELSHFTATYKESNDSYTISNHSSNGIIGTILVVEGAKCTADQVRAALAKGLVTSTSSDTPSEPTDSDYSDRWIRIALLILQEQHFASPFDISKFMTFAREYGAKRVELEGPSMVAYPGLHKEPEKKAKKNGFWISYPTESPNRNRNSPESRLYGGLM